MSAIHPISRRSYALLLTSVLAAAAIGGACSDSEPADVTTTAAPSTTAATEAPRTVTPDYGAETFVVNVAMTDEGYEPDTIHVPLGRQVKLVLRNRGTHEHHFRVVGLPSSDIRWYLVPVIDEAELLEMESEEAGFIDDPEHILHHITPEWVPFKEASLSGIKPLPYEVHGYAQVGTQDVMLFFPLTTGSYLVEDVLYPEITGTLVVFDPDI